MKKFVKITALSTLVLCAAIVIAGTIFVGANFAKYSSLKLDNDKISSPTLSVQIYDADNRPIKEENSFNHSFSKIEAIPAHVKNAFVAIEDKDFYSHHGLNFKRITKAGINNILSRSLKEGASTISQQLIKNTHLSSEKTFERKIKEIVLTRKLEKSHSKDEILESYLNAIYYGNNCYGIENAAEYYFSKEAKDLTLEEGALLAGMIKSPSKYSPILKEDNALKRRNLVLSEMQKSGFITEEEAFAAKEKPLALSLQTDNSNPINSYGEAALDEACCILKMPAKDIALNGYKLHTYLSNEAQNNLKNALESEDFASADHAAIVIDASRHAVTAFEGSSPYKILDAKRQPGSAIKPLLVYAPALNEDLISPETQLLDEPLALGEYNPKNVDGKFRGYLSATEAVSKSINIPAIKVLSYVGIDKAKAYAEELGIEFDELDNSYALALGGMRYGVSIKDLAQAYTVFPQNGNFAEAKFIEYITDSGGKILYHHKSEEKRVLREDAAYLMTTMLQEAAYSGTAKALGTLELPIAAKTGTVGRGKENLDAWCVAYTPSHVCAVWVGNLDNSPISVAGGNQPTRCVKRFFEKSSRETEGAFSQPLSVVEREIDTLSLENEHILKLAAPNEPERFKKMALFSVFNEPKDVTDNFIEVPETRFAISKNANIVTVKFNAQRNLVYRFYDGKKLRVELSNMSGETETQVEVGGESLRISVDFGDKKNTREYEFKLKKEAAAETQPEKRRKWFV